MRPVRRPALVASLVAVTACGGDTTPLPPLAEPAGYQRLVLDTTGSLVFRRMGMWVDTLGATRGDSGRVTTTTRMQTDMKIGGMSLVVDVDTEYDCAGRRVRMRRMRTVTGTMKGQPIPDSIARQVGRQQDGMMRDTTWRPQADTVLLATLCRRARTAGE